MNTWENSPSLTVVLSVSSFILTTEIGDADFFQSKGNLRSSSPRKERPLQSQPALCSCRQPLLLYRQHATWEGSKRPSSKTWEFILRHQPGWITILQLTCTSCVCTEVAQGRSPQPSECGRKARSDITVTLPAIGGGGCRAVVPSHTYTTHTHGLMSQIAL